jgi:hypothetical protein
MAMAMAMGKEEVVVKVEVVSLQVMQRTNIHLDLPHPREIHYQPLLAQRPSCPIVPPTAHGQRKTIRSSGTHLLLHISRALTEGNQRWPPINCAGELLEWRLAARYQDEIVSPLCETIRVDCADAARGAGDEGCAL